ncbi:MAG: ATP-dependent DNA helicase, partial [Clostridiaceae bacterium]|nr:ATP-dependent DNA helicase [Clostridiaceae bacterium]
MTNLKDQTEASAPAQPFLRIAVRTLVETVHRQGGLTGGWLSGGVTSAEGIRLHQHFGQTLQNQYPEAAIQTEVPLNTIYTSGSLSLKIHGRCDALLSLPSGPYLIEAKSFSGSADHLPSDGELLHWAQVKLYAWIYLADRPEIQSIRIGLAYLSLETKKHSEQTLTISRSDLERFFQKTCQTYIEFAGNLIKSKQIRDRSGLACRFPYSGLRTGQKRFMREVVGAARHRESIFIQAPTGIGKTVAALYPAAKIIANHWADHCFYLTNMTSTRLVADATLADLRRSGLRMKSIILYAKETICLEPEIYCDNRKCAYATAYYDHLPAALHDLFLLESIGRDEILACARKHHVCPFELSLDMALYCEFIICDYNYVFDPRVRLSRFFGDDTGPRLLLIDEAHNLPARSREMYSASIERQAALKAKKIIQSLFPALEQSLAAIDSYMLRLSDILAGNRPGINELEQTLSPDSIMVAESFRAFREKPTHLISLLGRFAAICRYYWEQNPDLPDRRPLLDFYFQALFFCRVAEEFHDRTYVTVANMTGGQPVLRLLCLDAAEKLAATYRTKHPAIFFSATLSPIGYYAGLLNGIHNWERHQTLQLESPFPSENLLILLCSSLSTRYQKRQETLFAIYAMIKAAVHARTGNYLVFVPSFAYLTMLRGLVGSDQDPAGPEFIFQTPNMSERLRKEFLVRFDAYGQKTLVGIAVMGGIFSEGIDLAGEKLSGVIVVGVGLPQISPEREISRQYYTEALGSGYEYAYLYPGFNRVQQAAGRVIRSETDRGFVLLIDDRYGTSTYHQLFPIEWQPRQVQSPDEVHQIL